MKAKKEDLISKFMDSLEVLSEDSQGKLTGGYQSILGDNSRCKNATCSGENEQCNNTDNCEGSDNASICTNRTTCII